MIRQVPHTVPGADPAGFAPALEVATELHAPATRAPEVATTTAPRAKARTATPRTRRRTAHTAGG